MEKYRLLWIGLIVGTILAAIIFFFGITYISTILIIVISLTVAALFIFGYLLIKYNANSNIELNKYEDNVKKLASEVKSIFPTIKDESSLKELISSSITSIRKISTSIFFLSTFFSLSMVMVGLLASAIAIKQNNTMKDQNYLICQQNQYLETNIKYNLFSDPNEPVYDYFDIVKSEIRKELEIFGRTISYMEKYWSYSSAIVSFNNQKFITYLPQKEYKKLIELRKEIIDIIIKNNLNNEEKFQSLVREYKINLNRFYTKLDKIKQELKNKAKNEKMNLIKNNEINCSKYNT